MKNIKYTFLGVIITLCLNSTLAQKSTGINNTSPNPKASLDISTSTTQGILIPRLPSSSKGTFGLTSSDKGMIFYGNDTDSIYYWTGNKWVSLALNGAASPSNYWSLSGNAPDSSVNYLGTNGFQPLILSTNGIQRMRISRNGNFGFNMNPNASVLMSIKSTGSGKVIQLEKSSGVTNLFELREISTGEGEIDLYNASGVKQVQINAGSGDNLFVGSGNFGIGVVPSGTKFEVRSNGSTPSTLNLRLTNAATQTLFVVDDAGGVTIPGLVGPGVVTANATGLLSLVAGSPTTGTGIANKVAFWNGTGTLSYNTNFHWDNTNGYLGIGSTTPTYPLYVNGDAYIKPGILGSAPYKGTSWFSIQHTSLPLDDISYGFAQHKGGYVMLNTPANAGSNYIDFKVSDVSQMRMNESGYLSIGTTATPLAALQVEKMVGNTVSIFKNTGNSAGIGLVTDWPGIYFNSYFNVTAKSMSTNAYAGMINFEPSTGDITFSTATTGGVANANLTFSEKMRIDATNGYVGIGTTSPLNKLDVYGGVAIGTYAGVSAAPTNGLTVSGYIGIGTASPGYNLDIYSTATAWSRVQSTSSYAGFILDKGATTANGYIIYRTLGTGHWYVGTMGNEDFSISRNFTNSDGSFLIQESTGNVGIGTIAPAYNLHVSQNAATPLYSLYTENIYSGNTDTRAIRGKAVNAPGFGYGADFEGGYRGVYALGNGTTYTGGVIGVYGNATGSAGTRYGVYGTASGGTTNYAGYFSGTLYATSVTGGSKPFIIDHPMDPENKFLYHSAIESPDMMNIYNGIVVTDNSGISIIPLPSYFDALNKDFKYQLTCIGQFAQAIVLSEISNNQFTIKTDKPNVKVSWQVTGIRKDKTAEMYRIVPEVDKKPNEKGKYLEPEAFGKPKSMGIHHIHTQERAAIDLKDQEDEKERLRRCKEEHERRQSNRSNLKSHTAEGK